MQYPKVPHPRLVPSGFITMSFALGGEVGGDPGPQGAMVLNCNSIPIKVLVRPPSPPRPIGLVEPTLLLDREGFDVFRCRRTELDARSHGPRPPMGARV